MEYYVYIIRSIGTGKFYTGMTSDIDRRIKEHNYILANTRTTRCLTDFELIFCQVVSDRQEARVLEKYLKSGSGREFRAEIVK